MTKKHTPGPWKWRAVPNENGQGTLALLLESEARPVPLNDPCILAVREDWFRALQFSPPGQADARLIALAPELLAFVEKCERAGAMASRGEDAIDLVRLIEMDARALLASVRS